MSVYLYTVFCETEGIEVSRWDTEPVEVCPNNKDHPVRPNSLKILKTINNNEVLVVPELNNTNGRFRAESRTMEIAANTTGVLDMSWPIDIGVRSVSFTVKTENEGDIFNCIVFPDTVIGITGTAGVVGDNTLVLLSPEFDKMQNGFILNVLDPSTGNVSNCQQIIDTDPTTSTITFENPLTFDHPQGNLVRFGVNNMRDFKLRGGHSVRFKSLGSTNSFVPKLSIVRITYQNDHTEPVTFNFHYEYFY